MKDLTESPIAYRKDGKIIIEMPEANLIFAAENSPHGFYEIADGEAYLNHVTAQLLEYRSGTDDDPMLFKVFDEITEHAAEYGEGVEMKDAD